MEERPPAALRRRSLATLDTIAAIGITVAILAAFVFLVAGRRSLDFAYMARTFGTLLPGLALAIALTGASFLIGLPIGFLTGWTRTLRGEPWAKLRARLAPPREPVPTPRMIGVALYALSVLLIAFVKRVARRMADGYVELMRGTPLFVQIFFVWSVFIVYFPGGDPTLTALAAGLVAMTVNTGGYQGEIFRGGLQAIHAGQLEAARAIGLSRWGAMRNIVLPQAVRLTIPPLLNEAIALFKSSSLLFFIGVHELTFLYRQLGFREARVLELFTMVTVLYLLFTVSLSRVVSFLEHRFRIPGLGMAPARGGTLTTRRLARKTAL